MNTIMLLFSILMVICALAMGFIPHSRPIISKQSLNIQSHLYMARKVTPMGESMDEYRKVTNKLIIDHILSYFLFFF